MAIGAKIDYVCDYDGVRLSFIADKYPQLEYTKNYDEILSNPDIKAVVIYTPAVSDHTTDESHHK